MIYMVKSNPQWIYIHNKAVYLMVREREEQLELTKASIAWLL